MWVIVEEKRVRHRWECAKCNKVEYVPPWYYSEMGTPVCKDCDVWVKSMGSKAVCVDN